MHPRRRLAHCERGRKHCGTRTRLRPGMSDQLPVNQKAVMEKRAGPAVLPGLRRTAEAGIGRYLQFTPHACSNTAAEILFPLNVTNGPSRSLRIAAELRQTFFEMVAEHRLAQKIGGSSLIVQAARLRAQLVPVGEIGIATPKPR